MAQKNQLYPDFSLTRFNCHEEPIHRPIAIQGQGHMLVLDSTQSLRLHAISDGLLDSFQQTWQSVWTTPVADWLGNPILEAVDAKLTKAGKNTLHPADASIHWTSPAGTAYSLAIHINAGYVVLEFEPYQSFRLEDSFLPSITRALSSADDLDSLFSAVSSHLKEGFGIDRVMVYQFDEDKHGCVVGEARRGDIEPYLGLHYPESDIPKIARELFLKVKSRLIPDIDEENCALHFNPQLGPNPPHLDLTYGQLRATSPIHIEYLGNMGVKGTMTVSIVVNNELWGLIACHQYSPLRVPFNQRVICETIGDLLGKRILELGIRKEALQNSEWEAAETAFLQSLTHSDNYRIEIYENASALTKMCRADGMALVTLKDCPHAIGLVPDKSTLIEFRTWLFKHGHHETFESSEVNTVYPLSPASDITIAGVMAICVSLVSQSYIFWFRSPVTKTVNWAGDPDNSYSFSTETGQEAVEIHPRQSFKKWQVTVHGKSERWDGSTIDLARRLRQGILRKELIYSAQLAQRTNEEFMQLTFAAAHDLQEPLRTQANYLELIEEELEGSENEDVLLFLKESRRAGSRMKELITDLLNYAGLSAQTMHKEVNLTDVMEELLQDLASTIEETNTRLTYDKLPSVLGDRSRLKQLLQNLITNAIKYVEPGKSPDVSVFMTQEGSFYTLCVKDNGIGIDPTHHETVFKMFKRLHRKSEYEGTGIGLANVKKVVESMDATVGIESKAGEGATFLVKFHQSAIVK